MASCSFPDVFSWIQNHQWRTNSNNNNSINLCPSNSSQPSLKLAINALNASRFSVSIVADYNLPISLWSSKKITLKPQKTPLDHDDIVFHTLLCNSIDDVLKYSSHKSQTPFKLPKTTLNNNNNNSQAKNIKDVFNFSFLALTFIVCIYEAPEDVRATCLDALRDGLACPRSRHVSRSLMMMLGSNVEEQWMRSMNLAITNWIAGRADGPAAAMRMPSSLFSYGVSGFGMWKVQLYCPVMAMGVENSSEARPDERLMYSLNYHQVEGVIQLNYRVAVREKWVEVVVNTDNIRCDVIKLLTNTLMNERGAGASEKHFPSRISLEIAPTTAQSNVISVSVSKSSENHATEIGLEKGIEASFDPPTAIGLHFSAGETVTTSLKPWKFEQSVFGSAVNLNWFLHDSADGREVFSSKPSKLALFHPKSWFKNRYSSANRPFTRRGGVVFAGDEYGESVSWKLDKGCCVGGEGVMEWEIKGWIWLTYWPNKHRTFYTETRRLEFREAIHLTLG